MSQYETRKKAIVVFGTRPEAIKMCPLVKELKTRPWVETRVCVTGQHRQMLDQVLKIFDVEPDYDLSIMLPDQTLFDVTTRTLNLIRPVLEDYMPDLVFVHGDTTTAFAAALACFYLQIPVAHVEAGLRTFNIYNPFPEEYNRQAISLVARYHFAPTQMARYHLRIEGKERDNIFVTGNTGIDALRTTVRDDYSHPLLDWVGNDRLLLITAHRRENLGEPMRHMFRAIREILDEYPDVKAIYPMHLNPHVREVAKDVFAGCGRIMLIDPMDPVDFHNFISKAYLILTDSGGIQEEASFFGKPVLVMRKTTERPEGVDSGTLMLVGTEAGPIYQACRLLLDDQREYARMSRAKNPYGDGNASGRIVDILEKQLFLDEPQKTPSDPVLVPRSLEFSPGKFDHILPETMGGIQDARL